MKKIPLNDLSRMEPSESESIKQILASVVDSGHYILGDNCDRFEEKFSSYIGVEEAVVVGSGTDAIELALRALEVGYGDFVATVGNAGGYSSTAICAVGATPVYVDCDSFGRMDPNILIEVINRVRGIKVIVVTHLYGLSSHIEEICKIASEFNIPILEDCAQSIGAEVDGQKLGCFGRIATFSFYPTKNLGALGDAGAVVTADKRLAVNLRMLRQYGWKSRYVGELKYGQNSRMDEFQAAILLSRLGGVQENNQKRRQIWSKYSDALSSSPYFLIGEDSPSFVAHLGVLVIPKMKRSQAASFLANRGVDSGIHYPTLDHQQKPWFNADISLPVASELVQRILTIPLFPSMTPNEIEVVTEALRDLAESEI